MHLEISLLSRRGINASELSDAEMLGRIKPLAEGAISLWEMAKQGGLEDAVVGRDALRKALQGLGPRYVSMLDELPRFEGVDQEL